MKTVKTKRSGIMGWQDNLRHVFASLGEFQVYDNLYGYAKRLGYKSAKAAWRANPMVEGSVIPADLRKVKS